MDFGIVSIQKHTKKKQKELGRYPATLTSRLVNNQYLLHVSDKKLFYPQNSLCILLKLARIQNSSPRSILWTIILSESENTVFALDKAFWAILISIRSYQSVVWVVTPLWLRKSVALHWFTVKVQIVHLSHFLFITSSAKLYFMWKMAHAKCAYDTHISRAKFVAVTSPGMNAPRDAARDRPTLDEVTWPTL